MERRCKPAGGAVLDGEGPMDKGVTAVAFGREARQVPLAFASFHSLALVATGTRRAVRVAASAGKRPTES